MNYYNDNDPYVCQWTRNLIAAGLIPKGTVDERPIQEVRPADLAGHRAVHLFAGIAGWARAIELAGWPESEEVWTVSCPCTPYSVAGRRCGEADERNLWPHALRLIQARHPQHVFGEQVAGAIRFGWLDGVFDDLEAEGYRCGAVVLPACGVGAPHIRQRLYWVADTAHANGRPGTGWTDGPPIGNGRGLGNVDEPRLQGRGDDAGQYAGQHASGKAGTISGLADADSDGGRTVSRRAAEGRAADFWSDSVLIPCADGKARRIGVGIQSLAHGVPARVGRLRAAGNSIVPPLAAEFVRAYMECKR